VAHLGVPHAFAVKNCKDEYGAYVSYKTLKTYYEDYLSAATRLRDAQTLKEIRERDRHMIACLKCYFLYLI